MGVNTIPRINDLSDERQQFVLNQFLTDIRNMAFQLTFLDSDGGVTGGRRSYNFDAVWVAYVSNAVANTEDTVAHNLGRVPQAFFQGMPDKAAVVIDTGTAWTDTNIFISANAATVTVNLLLF